LFLPFIADLVLAKNSEIPISIAIFNGKMTVHFDNKGPAVFKETCDEDGVGIGKEEALQTLCVLVSQTKSLFFPHSSYTFLKLSYPPGKVSQL